MGGQDFSKFYIGKLSPEDAFRELKESAAYEDGHGGYTGTIAEKDGFIMKEYPPRKTLLTMQVKSLEITISGIAIVLN